MLSVSSKAQEVQDTLTLYQAYPSLSDTGKKEWAAFQYRWSHFYYPLLKATRKISKFDCASCESFYADVYIEIDNLGMIRKAIAWRVIHCGALSNDKALRDDFERTVKLRPMHFLHLKNKCFTARMGYALKC